MTRAQPKVSLNIRITEPAKEVLERLALRQGTSQAAIIEAWLLSQRTPQSATKATR